MEQVPFSQNDEGNRPFTPDVASIVDLIQELRSKDVDTSYLGVVFDPLILISCGPHLDGVNLGHFHSGVGNRLYYLKVTI